MSFQLDALNGSRKVKFTIGANIAEIINTDYYLKRTYELNDDGSRREIISVTSTWWGSPTLSQRELVDNLRTTESNFFLFQDFKGGTGTLIIDEGDPSSITFTDVTLEEIDDSWEGSKGFFEYSLIFKGKEIPGQNGETNFPRELLLEQKTPLTTILNSVGFPFITSSDKASETLFKPMYRTNPFRVEQGLPLTTYTFDNVRYTATLTETTPAGKVAEMEQAHSTMLGFIGKPVKITLDSSKTYTRIIDNLDLQSITINELTPSKMLLSIVATGGWF